MATSFLEGGVNDLPVNGFALNGSRSYALVQPTGISDTIVQGPWVIGIIDRATRPCVAAPARVPGACLRDSRTIVV
jgi:hypothetical protein